MGSITCAKRRECVNDPIHNYFHNHPSNPHSLPKKAPVRWSSIPIFRDHSKFDHLWPITLADVVNGSRRVTTWSTIRRRRWAFLWRTRPSRRSLRPPCCLPAVSTSSSSSLVQGVDGTGRLPRKSWMKLDFSASGGLFTTSQHHFDGYIWEPSPNARLIVGFTTFTFDRPPKPNELFGSKLGGSQPIWGKTCPIALFSTYTEPRRRSVVPPCKNPFFRCFNMDVYRFISRELELCKFPHLAVLISDSPMFQASQFRRPVFWKVGTPRPGPNWWVQMLSNSCFKLRIMIPSLLPGFSTWGRRSTIWPWLSLFFSLCVCVFSMFFPPSPNLSEVWGLYLHGHRTFDPWHISRPRGWWIIHFPAEELEPTGSPVLQLAAQCRCAPGSWCPPTSWCLWWCWWVLKETRPGTSRNSEHF